MVQENFNTTETILQNWEKTQILPEKQLQFNENGSITIPEVTLWNPNEVLKYLKNQEKIIIAKLRESNNNVFNEVKWMLENIQWWLESYWDKLPPAFYQRWKKEKNADMLLKFLSEYEWSLENFMDVLVANFKKQIGRWDDDRFYMMCRRIGISKDEFMKLDNQKIIEKIKEDINKIPTIDDRHVPSWWLHDRYHVANFYFSIIQNTCTDFWYYLNLR